jgi:hypothetical protein
LRISALAISACLLAIVGTAPTIAAPVAGAASSHAQTQSGVTHVQQRKYDGKHDQGPKNFNQGPKKGPKFDNDHRGPGHGFRPGSRHSHAPKGWHRHSKRPSYWQTRGCVVVGPVWFCP